MGVTGIGGFGFRARDPQALAAWYAEHFGVGAGEHGMWEQQAGTTVFAVFDEKTDYIPAGKQWMLNLRVEDLDSVIAYLKSKGIEVITKPDEWDAPGVGRFARIHDPEGNPVELWEPD